MSKKKMEIPDAYMSEYDGFGTDWISTSSLSLLQMCGQCFYLKYILRVPESVGVRLSVGSATHKARQINLGQKVKSCVNLEKDQVTDAARDEVNKKVDGNEFKVESEFGDKSKKAARGIAVDMAVQATGCDYDVFQIGCTPAAVEEPMAVKYESLSRIIVGKIDLRTTDWYIDDLKTSKRAKGQNFADTSQGLTTYGLLSWINHGVIPKGYRVQNVVLGTKGVKAETYQTTRTEQDMKRQLARFAAAIQAIEKGAFVPASSESWKCSEDWCGYYNICEFGGGE